jgi:formate hydrogenlyase transcriptional activator
MTDLIGFLSEVRHAIEQVASTNATVLLLGETGTGKELVARAIHAKSRRAHAAFVPVNCGALPASLIASELFGYEAGAFTGAVRRCIGRFEQAHGGTLFLDEVGELPLDVQASFLRVLQDRVINRLGGEGRQIPTDVRFITATNRDLAAHVRAGRFREDVFYRLNVFPITLPPLRERKTDIALLAAHFLTHFAKQHGKPATVIPTKVLRVLESHDWPGNVRELQNVIERAVIISAGEELAVDPAWFATASPKESARTWAEQEKERIVSALRAANGRVYGPGGAAQRLGLKPTTLYGKMRKHGLKREGDWR